MECEGIEIDTRGRGEMWRIFGHFSHWADMGGGVKRETGGDDGLDASARK
jgi:hypothetical protein